jgi:hypothetical protein
VRRAIVLVVLVAVPAFADEIYLRGGGRISGEIVSRTEDSVTVDIGGGTLTAKMSSVVRIEESVSPLQEYRARAAKVPAGDAEAWRELARWATGETLSSQAAEAYEQVLAVLPKDEEANRALGRVLLNGSWVSEEESYRSRGYVEFEGEWVTPGERQAILTERQARKEADRREIDAKVRDIEAEQRAEKEREARERAESDSWARMGDPVYWGWGAGPTTWPGVTPSQPRELAGGSTWGQ